MNCVTDLYIYKIKAILTAQLNILHAHFEIWTAQIGWTARLEYAVLGGLGLSLQKLTTISRFNITFDTISRSFSAVSGKFRSCTVFMDRGAGTKSHVAADIGRVTNCVAYYYY